MSFSNYVLSNVLNEGLYDPAIFKVVFLAGGPGSGKSFIVGKTALSSLGFVTINSDIPFENLMRKLGLDFKMPESETEQRNIARDAAKATADKKMDLALGGRLGLVIDGTGRDFGKIKSMKTHLSKMGYDSAMIFVNTDLETALDRNAKRERSVPESVATKLWKDVQANIGKFQHEFGKNLFLVDNSQGSDYNSQVNSVYKKISSWSKSSPTNKIAKEWIASEKSARGIKESHDLLEYRIRSSHNEDCERLKEDGYNCAKNGNIRYPEESSVYGELINKYYDVPLVNRIHLKNAWMNGFRSFANPEQEIIEKENIKMKDGPCWDDYEMIGSKEVNGKKVPNCVPKKDVTESEILDEATLVLKKSDLADYFSKAVKSYIENNYDDKTFLDGLSKLLNKSLVIEKKPMTGMNYKIS